MKIDNNSNILIIGQHLTSRTEAVRDFCLSRANRVTVIALGAAFVDKKENHLFEYERGTMRRHRIFRHGILKKSQRYEYLVPATFLSYLFDIFRALVVLKKRYDVYIGISHFSGFIGVLLKCLRICRTTVYYAIDCYTRSKEDSGVKAAVFHCSNIVDVCAVVYSDQVWDISPRISEGRNKYKILRLSKDRYAYKNKIVPLGYSRNFFRNKDVRNIDRYVVVFVGVIVQDQGLELLLEALPEIKKDIPAIKVRVIGTGPFLPKFKEQVHDAGFEGVFQFYGFVESNDAMLDIISSSAVGVSVWGKDQNSYYGDPGKTKLYSVCGLPVIVSNDTVYSHIIARNRAGIAISYDRKELVSALTTLLRNDTEYPQFKANAVENAQEYCDSEKIFSSIVN